jgi:HSP20 family protein
MLLSEYERIGRFLDPWREFERLNRALTGLAAPSGQEFPPINLWTGPESSIVTIEVPGIEPDAIDIQVVGNALTIKGGRAPRELKDSEAYHRRERWAGQFARTIQLPYEIQADKVEARVSKGVLTITLPRAEADKPKKIGIKSV